MNMFSTADLWFVNNEGLAFQTAVHTNALIVLDSKNVMSLDPSQDLELGYHLSIPSVNVW